MRTPAARAEVGASRARGAVVVGLDGTGTDQEAVSWGVAQARRAGRALHLLRVLDDGAGAQERWGDLQHERRRARRLATVHDPVLRLSVEVVVGRVVPLLLAASHEAHLLVLGDSRLREVPDRPEDQVAVRVAAGARCPVVVVRRRGDGGVLAPRGAVRPGVVVGVGGESASALRAALEAGVEQAVERGCALTVVHLWPLDRAAWWAADAAWGARERRVAGALADARRRHPDLPVRTATARTGPVEGLAAHARGAQLLVLPCGVDRRGVPPLPDPLVRQVLRSARCSVAVVNGGVTTRPGREVVRTPVPPPVSPSTWSGPPVPRGAVVVALDGGPADHAAVRWGAEQATPTGRRLHLVHVVHDVVPVVADTAGTVVMPSSDVLAGAAGAARAHAHELADALAPDAGVSVSVVTGHTVPLLVAASQGAHLLVLGDTRLRTAPGRTSEQVAVFLAVRARCPVVVVPSGDRAGGDRRSSRARLAQLARRREVVVGVDGTHAGRGALELAFTHASTHGCSLRVVHAWPPRTPSRRETDPGWVRRRAMVSQLLAGYRERHPGVLVVVDLVRGDPVAALLGHGRDWQAELLVLSGCHGQGRRGLLPGPVTLGVLGQAGCPVATVRDDGVGEHLWHRPRRTAGDRAREDATLVRA